MTGRAGSILRTCRNPYKPETGYVANANNRLVESEAVPPITRYWQDDLRYRRLKKLLDNARKHTLDTFHAIQQDINGTDADMLLPVLLQHTGPAGEREAKALEILKDWDRQMSADQAAPLIFTRLAPRTQSRRVQG